MAVTAALREWGQRQWPAGYTRWLRARRHWEAWRHADDLSRLSLLFATDKWATHWYTQHYQRYFAPLRHRRVNLLEIGVGGYDDPEAGGQSLRMWKAYFPHGRIVGLDIHDKRGVREPRIEVERCDQTDAEALRRLSERYGGFDIVVDDGSHRNQDVIASFEALFPLLRDGGIYAIEDTQTAYWPSWGGGRDAPGSSMAYFKRLVDGLNHAEFAESAYRPSYYDLHIVELAFFHNLVLIRKGDNNERSNAGDLRLREIAGGELP